MFDCFPFSKKSAPKAEELMEEAEVQKEAMMGDAQFKREAERIASMQKKMLAENPDFQEQLVKVMQGGKMDSAELAKLLEKQRQMIAENPLMKQAVANQERILNNNPELREKMLQLGKMQNQVLHKEVLLS